MLGRKPIYNTPEEKRAAKMLSQKKYREANRDACILRTSNAKKKRWHADAEYRSARLLEMKEYNSKKTLERQKEKYEMLKMKFEPIVV